MASMGVFLIPLNHRWIPSMDRLFFSFECQAIKVKLWLVAKATREQAGGCRENDCSQAGGFLSQQALAKGLKCETILKRLLHHTTSSMNVLLVIH